MKQFLAGMAVATLGITLLSTISEIGASLGQLVNAKLAVKIQECSVKIQNMSEPPAEHTPVIGFTIPDDIEEDDYD